MLALATNLFIRLSLSTGAYRECHWAIVGTDKVCVGFPSSTQPTRFAITLQRLHENEVALVGVYAGGSGSMAEKADSVISQLKA